MYRKHFHSLFVACLGVTLLAQGAAGQDTSGVDTYGIGPSEVQFGSIVPVVTETGFISLSIDGAGTNAASAIIQVDKPAGATVRSAFMAAASTGFSGRKLSNGDVRIDGVGVSWLISTPSSISSWNHWADVTSMIKPKIDAAAPGLINFTMTEVSTRSIDGELIVVIFDDPNETTSNTVILLFGAQAIAGDTFAIALADPLDKNDADLVMDLSLGISFGFTSPRNNRQRSLIDVNGIRMTSSAGGQDDSSQVPARNGTLLTVGGLGDTNSNPPPFSLVPFSTGDFRFDDELYNLLPFVNTGDTSISVFTINPSNDDNIYFAALFLASTTAIVGEGIVLGPAFDVNEAGTNHTVTATVQDDDGNPIVGRTVTFLVISGPNAGDGATAATDANGQASFTYTGDGGSGVDEIQATFVDSQGNTVTSNAALKEWVITNLPPLAVCKDVTRSADSNCEASVMPAEVDNGSFDPDGDPIALALTPMGPFPLGVTNVVLTVTDCSNESDSCTATVTVVDDAPPTITCPADATNECPADTSVAANGSATASDNCDAAPSIGSSDASVPGCGNTETITRSWTATDAATNSSSCDQTITVEDTTPPAFTGVPAAVTVTDVDCSGDEPVALGAATATDDCGTVTITDDAPATFPAGQTTTVTFTATDECNNSSSASTTVTVLYGADIWVEANKHTVGGGSNPGSTKEPFVGIEICAYDKADGSCARVICGGISHQHYECIATTCAATNCCTTDANGECNLNLPPGDYVVISIDATKTTLPDPLGVSASDLVCGEHKQKHLQQIVKIRSDGSTKKTPGKTTRRTGSELLIIEPEFVVWDGTVQEYPFVFETVGDWGITASVSPPEGFVADYDALSASVDNELQAVQFTITEVGSDLVPTGTTFDVTHKGRREIIHSQVDIFLTAKYARSRGFNVAQLRAAGLIKELPEQAQSGQSHRGSGPGN